MKNDPTLYNIYLKIHNKRTLILDDLRYLAEYAPECFEKTCKNLVYNLPEAKPLMEPPPAEAHDPNPAPASTNTPAPLPHSDLFMPPALMEKEHIEFVLDNIKHLEANDLHISNVDANQVKTLLGSLYMELLFPHNDMDSFFCMRYEENSHTFDRKA